MSSNSKLLQSNVITIPNGAPNLPNIGYYNSSEATDSNSSDPNNYSYQTLQNNLNATCTLAYNGSGINNVNGVYEDPTKSYISSYIPANTTSLDVPFYLAKSGVLMKADTDSNLKSAVLSKVDAYCTDKSKVGTTKDNINNYIAPIINQIQYSTCQLELERNRVYNPSTFQVFANAPNIKDMFNTFGNLKPFLIGIFIMSMYLLFGGIFGSIDIVSNIFNIITESSKNNISYWVGLLIGIIIPVIVLILSYINTIKKSRSTENYEITTSSEGVQNTISTSAQNIDYMTLALFILLIYALIAVLFTIKRSYFSLFIYTGLITVILSIITIFIYIFYTYLPFLNLTNEKQLYRNQSLRLYISEQQNISKITTNKDEINNIQNSFRITFLVICIITIVYFIIGTKITFVSGLLSSSAILFIPLIWICNILFAITFFYVYPIIFMVIRFLRYVIMSGIYIASERNSALKDKFSEDLVQQLDNFKNYTPSWGLIGIDEFKLFLNFNGYKNLFSASIIPENEIGKNVSLNKFISSGFLNYIVSSIAGKERNTKGIIYGVLLLVVTIVISCIILFLIYEI
jgi:hypothetical protein